MNFIMIFARTIVAQLFLAPFTIFCCMLAILPAVSNGANAPAGHTSPRVATAEPTQVIVSDITDQPLEGVAVMTQPRPDMLLPENLHETTITVTDKAGIFQQPQIEVGGTYIVLRKPGYEALALNAAHRFPRRITLRPGRTITGQVFTADGQPVSGALVGPLSYTENTLRRGNAKGGLLPRVVTRTGPDGSFKLDSLPLENLAIQFSAPGHTPRIVSFNAGESAKKIALMTGGSIIKGSVIGSKDRAPQALTPVEATDGHLELFTTTDAKGTYVFDNMPTGTWRLRPAGGGPLSGTQSRIKVIDLAKLNEVKDVPLVLNQGVLLAGRAVDALTSRGLPGINITLSGYAGRGARATLTDSDGSFAFENLDSMQGVLIRFDPVKFVYVLSGGTYRDYFDISQAGNTDFDLTTLTIPLHRRQEVQGKVVSATGQPATDVEVRLQNLQVVTSAPTKSGPGPLEFAAYTNGAGEFRTGVYPPGQYKVWAQQDALVSQVETIDAYTTSPMPSVNLKLDQAAQLEGMVTSANDEPVTAAIVIAWAANTPEPEEDPIPGRDNYRLAKTDADGHFVLSGLRGEPLMLRATHPGYVQPVKMPFDPSTINPATSSSVVLKFMAGGEFEVFVTDDQGQPVSQAEVALDYRIGLDGQRVSIKTDPYGRAAVSAIPAKKLEKVTINHPTFAPYENEAPVNLPQTGLKVSLKKRGSLVASVQGEPQVPGVAPEIFLLHAPPTASNDKAPSDIEFQQTARVSVVAGKALFPNLPPGWYKAAYAESGAYAESQVVRMEAGSGDQQVELTLPTGNHLVGMVTDKQTGEGIAGANITLRPALEVEIVRDRAVQNTSTVDGGAFELYNVGAGRLHVKVVAAGYPDTEETITFTPGDTVDITMSNVPAALSGRVTVGGSPVEGALLILMKSGAQHTPVATAISDESGAYLMEDFSAGSHLLSVEAPIGEGENISRKSIPVQIEDANATQDVEFKSLVAINGNVQIDGKKPTGDAKTILFRGLDPGSESKMVQLNKDGSYQAQLEPGNYQVSLEDMEGRPVEVPDGATHKMDLSF